MKLLVSSWRFLTLPGISANANGKVRGDVGGWVGGQNNQFKVVFRLGAITSAKERLIMIHKFEQGLLTRSEQISLISLVSATKYTAFELQRIDRGPVQLQVWRTRDFGVRGTKAEEQSVTSTSKSCIQHSKTSSSENYNIQQSFYFLFPSFRLQDGRGSETTN